MSQRARSALRLCVLALALSRVPGAIATPAPEPAAAAKNVAAAPAEKATIERGRFLTAYGGCGDCHTPKLMTAEGPTPDSSRLLSGHPAGLKLPPPPTGLAPDGWESAVNSHLTAWVGPWGISFATNLTPDVETGIGSWTPEMFVKAMQTGKHLGEGRPILPPMPWRSVAELSESDLRALFAYLRSVPPVRNVVPDPLPPATKK